MIGFIGLGNMGAPMARNLLKAGRKLVVYDVVSQNVEQLRADGAAVAGNPADVAAGAKEIVTMLPSSPHVLDVYTGDKGIFKTIKPGTLCIDSSTIDPATSRQLASSAKTKQATYLDAPVSGGIAAAQGGQLTFMVGGDKAAFDNSQSILKQMGKNIVYCGDSGNGQAAKICNNMLLGICMIGTAEAFNLGQKLGLDPKLLASIINTSSGRNWSSELYNPVPGVLPNSAASRDYEGGFNCSLMAKDLGLAQTAAMSSVVLTPLGALAYQLYRLMGQLPDYQKKDFSAVYQFLRKSS